MNTLKISKLFIVLILILFSCKKEDQKTVHIKQDSIVKMPVPSEDDLNVNIDDCEPEKTSAEYITLLENLHRVTIDKISTNSLEENNQLYEHYIKKRLLIISCLMVIHQKVLDDFINYYDEKINDYNLPPEMKLLQTQLQKVDLEYMGVGEGFTEIVDSPNHYVKMFKGSVTSDYEDFMKQESLENANLYSADAGIIIPWKELGDRVVFWENFLQKHPQSLLREKAEDLYNRYLDNYIFGMDNTRTSEHGKLYPEIATEFDRFIKSYPHSKVTLKILNYRKLLDSGKTMEEIRKIMEL